LSNFCQGQELWRSELETVIIKNTVYVEPQISIKTGTLTVNEALVLYCLTRYFSPSKIVEIGTYIGTSTVAMAKAISDNNETDGRIWSCDFSNDVSLVVTKGVQIDTYGFKSSLDMLSALNEPIDLFFVDGSLGEADIDHMCRLCHDKSILILDDFEGSEKGVRNGLLLEKRFPNHILIYPMSEAQADRWRFARANKFGVFFPRNLLSFTRQ
jgi:hypothetical protein